MANFKEAELREKVKTKWIEKPKDFYKEKFLNYTGKTKDTKKYYSEVIADELRMNYTQVGQSWENIAIRNTKSFNLDHNGNPNVYARLQRFNYLKYSEKLLAIALFNSKKTYCLGEIINYEVPLKEKQSDKYGKIDLISRDDHNKSVKLIELKIKNDQDDKGTDETLLRALLEIYTYYKLIRNSKSQDKFLEDFKLPKDYRLQPAILTDELALSGQTMRRISEHPCLQALISAMSSEIDERIEGFVYDYPNRGKSFRPETIMLQGDITISQNLLNTV